jgi:NADPH:quinone reductase-like Zn-dependent oxidoreductase
MRAIRQDRLGQPDVLQLVQTERPEPGPTEVLVRVAAAGVNPVDWKVRRSGGLLRAPPFTVGWDIAGTVEALGAGVARFAIGDRVLGMPWFPKQAAAYAEYVTAPSRHLAAIPDGLTDSEAAALPLAGLTAWQALVDTARVQAGEHVLILAAAGGVGHLAVQIAKARGARVTGTARAARHAWLRDLGADALVDYVTEDVGRAGPADVVLDLVGGAAGLAALPAARDGGLFITIPSGADVASLREAANHRVRIVNMLVEPDHAGLEALTALVAQGDLQIRVAHTFPLADAASAHRMGESGTIGGGKLVLLP